MADAWATILTKSFREVWEAWNKSNLLFLRVFIVYIVLGMVKMHALPGLILWSSLWMAKIPAQQRLAVGITPPYLYQLSKRFFQLIGMDVLLN